MKYKCYDTCSLLEQAGHLFDSDEFTLVISSITLEELENIKTSGNKDPDVKYAARKVLTDMDEHYGAFEIVLYNDSYGDMMMRDGISLSNDAKIIACARHFAAKHPQDEVIFVTNDLICRHIASMYFITEKVIEEDYDYDGYKEVYLDEDGLIEFYSNQDKNLYDLFINQYLLVYDANSGDCIERLVWIGDGYRRLAYNTFASKWFGDVKPMKGDLYQSLVADSFSNNKITLVKGPAGSGKTYLSLGFLMHKLERNKIDRIIVFCNTVATKNSAKLGFYPGTRDEKLLDSQIGNLLISKFGGRVAVEQMILEEKLVLLPLSDIRGYDTSGMKAGIYISEAQNMDVELMKLTLQRIGEDSICIIDGDCKTQVDDIHFAGSNNGMRRASQVYRGEDVYGEVTLRNIHRSRVAMIAEKM
jgi:predicted ribonuclease YlaK